MKLLTDCKTVLSLRDEYLHHGGSVALVETHLSECERCLDAFLEVTLRMQPSVVPPDNFVINVAALPNFTPETSTRRFAILGASGLIGGGGACLTGLMFAGDRAIPLDLITATGALILTGAILIEFAAVLFLPGIIRTD